MAVETAMMVGYDDFRTGPHSVSKLTLTGQWAGGGAGSDAAYGGVAAAEATYHRQRMHG